MELNLYDIVEYNGNKHRIMAIDSYDGDLDLAGVSVWVNPDLVTLVEPFTAPTFEIGDEVIILPIPPEEQEDYPCGWDSSFNDIASERDVCEIMDVDSDARICLVHCKVGHFWLASYHLEKIPKYDMV